MKTVAPYGSWPSPIAAADVAQSGISLESIFVDNGKLYWCERRPTEKGRSVVVTFDDAGQKKDLVPADFNARTRVHEYGGVCQLVVDGVVYSSNFGDGCLYRAEGDEVEVLTPAGLGYRYADLQLDKQRRNLIAVREDHSGAGEAVNTLVRIDLDQVDGGTVITSGYDFYAAPRLSPDGSQLAWLSWNHPNMPFDGTTLWVASVDENGDLGAPTLVSGSTEESVAQPAWSPAGELFFVSDKSGWWNLYRWDGQESHSLCPMAAEFTLPPWVFGLESYDFYEANELICSYFEPDGWKVGRLDWRSGALTTIEQPSSTLAHLHVAGDQLFYVGGSPTAPISVIQLDLTSGAYRYLVETSNYQLDEGNISLPQPIEFPTENGLTAHAYYYPPQNKDYEAAAGEKPPLIVMSHGGPTSATNDVFSLGKLFFTTRGFAVVDVNYGGSTGYGRAYRQRLNGQWGIVDVDDCVNAAKYLVEQGLADPDRLAIRGGSAGGFTTMAALTFRDYFSAGCSLFGVSDLEALARETHKFESRYLDGLVGKLPEDKAIYDARSPIKHIDQLETPMLFLQGLEDKVVPPNQSELMFIELRNKEIPTAYVAYEGEGHGFRQADNIINAIESELSFYGKIFGFAPAGNLPEITIENLHA
ncbi:MAG: S9 family peptidase [Anaerolineales bacterium]|nr:S9 family peptidase [Anaerolineales bacterium]